MAVAGCTRGGASGVGPGGGYTGYTDYTPGYGRYMTDLRPQALDKAVQDPFY